MDIGTIEAALKLRDDASAAIARFQKNLTGLGTSAREVSSAFQRVGLAVTAGIAAPLIGAIKSAKDFESAFANVVRTVGDFDVDPFGHLTADAEAFRKSLLDLSTTIPVTAEELANIASIGGQFGVAEENVLSFTETVAKLGVAIDGLSAEDAAASIAQIATVTGEGEQAFKQYADVLVDLGNKGTSTQAEILEFAKRLSGAGHQAGLTGKEIFALGASMANVGLNAEAGGTAMSRLISKMSVAGAGGAEASQKFADFAGRIDSTVASGEKFAELFQSNAKRALELFFDGLSDAAASGSNLNVILTDLGVNEVRQRDTMNRLAGAAGMLGKQFDIAAQAADNASALNDAARKRFATFDSQLQLFLNSVKLVAIEIGTPLIQALNDLLQRMKPVTDGMIAMAREFKNLPPIVKEAVAVLGAGTGMTGVLLLLGGTAARAAIDIGLLVKAFKGMAGTEAAVATTAAAKGIQSIGTSAASTTGSVFALSRATTAFGYSMEVAAPATAEAAGATGLLSGAAVIAGAKIAALVAVAVGLQYLLYKLTDGMGAFGGAIRTAVLGPTHSLQESALGLVELFNRWRPVIDDLAVVLNDRLAKGLRDATSAIKPMLDSIKQFKDDAVALGDSLLTKVDTALRGFKAIVLEVVPGMKEMATAVAFVTGKSAEWQKALHDEAEAIRKRTASATDDVKVTNVLSEAQVLAGLRASEAAAAQDAAREAQAKARIELERILAAVKALDPEQRRLIDGYDKIGMSVDDISKKLHIGEDIVRAYQKAQTDAATSSKNLAKESEALGNAVLAVRMSVIAVNDEIQDFFDKQEVERVKDVKAAMKDLNLELRKTQDAIDLTRATRGMSKEFKALATATTAWVREIEDLQHEASIAEPELKAFYDRLIDLKQTQAAEELGDMVIATEEFYDVLLMVNPRMAEMVRLAQQEAGFTKEAKEKTKDWTDSLSDLSTAFSNLAEVSGSEGLGFAARMVAQADIALQSFGKVREGIKEFAKGAKADLVSAFADMATGIATGLAGVIGATDPSKDLGERLLGGAIQGASLGASAATLGATIAGATAKGAAVAGVWGAAAGVIVGIMIAVFRGRKTRREMEIVGQEWGTDISKGLYDKIKKDQKDLFDGDRVAASIFNFSEILNEAGGLNDLNFDTFLGKLRDVFVMIETGKFSTEQALQVMEENFSAFAQHVIDSGEFAAQGFLEILNLNISSGLNSPEIQAFILGRAGVIGEGLAAMMGPVVEGAAKVGDRVREAFKSVDDLIKNGKKGTEEYEAAVAELNEALRHQQEVAAGAIGDLENIGVIALATFARARESGLSFVEALNAIGPALDTLIQAQRDLGIEGSNSAINQLMHYRELANQFPTLVNAAAALGPTLVALQQMGGLTAESLAAIEDQGMRTFNRLIDAGFTENEALAQMADFLKNVEKAHKQLGIPIDENTQRMIDQARQAGLMGDEAVDATTQQRRGFEMVTRAINALIVTLGGVPIAIDDISQALDDLPDTVEVDVVVNPPDIPNDFPTQRPGQPPQRPEETPPPPGTPDPNDPAFWQGQTGPVGAATASPRYAGAYATQTVVIQVDGEVLTRTVVEGMPDYVRLRAGEAGQ